MIVYRRTTKKFRLKQLRSLISRKPKCTPCRISRGCQSDKRICYNELRGLWLKSKNEGP